MILKLKDGDVKIELFPDVAPKHVERIKKLAEDGKYDNVETIFLMSDVENQIISSKFVKEIISLGGDIKKFTTKSTIKSLKQKT